MIFNETIERKLDKIDKKKSSSQKTYLTDFMCVSVWRLFGIFNGMTRSSDGWIVMHYVYFVKLTCRTTTTTSETLDEHQNTHLMMILYVDHV